MHPLICWLLVFLALGNVGVSGVLAAAAGAFRAGAAAMDISPTGFPVRVNAMFTERSADRTVDSLFAKAIALDDGTTRLVLCGVDSCMLPRDLIDQAKTAASRVTGIPVERMLVSATHTHSAPSAMGCLGSRVDRAYAAFLPGRITAAITGAVQRLQPARASWSQVNDWEHTFNRRWIRRPDRLLTDPFGQVNVRAHMHPGYLSPDAIGPSGPVDPQLSVLALQRLDGKPLALLANYSMHYYDSPLLSSDYYGRFARHVAALLEADGDFVGIMSQGTSGDLARMDYGGAKAPEIGYDAYARELAEEAARLVKAARWHETVPLQMTEQRLELGYRVPDAPRLAWAAEMAAKLGDKRPQTQPEIYALEAIHLHDRPRTELRLQAWRIGELGIAAWPNEVFALSGLKVKRQSPLPVTFNIELANGAEGYIPPPEQHFLGGYTTWAARTAGLETNAEPRLVEALLGLLETVAGRPRRAAVMENGPYAQAVLADQPVAYWRFEEMAPPKAQDVAAVGAGAPAHDGTFEPGVACFLPGADGRIGHQPPQPPGTNAFSGTQINRCVHFAGGRMRARVPLGESYSVELWLWNGLAPEVRPVAGYVFSRGADGDSLARGEHLGIGGTYRANLAGKLILFNGNERNEVLAGRTPLAVRTWHHVVLVREGGQVRVHLDGRAVPEISGAFAHTVPVGESTLFIGGRNDSRFNFEGKLDEVSVYPRALTPSQIAAHYQAAALPAPPATAAAAAAPPSSAASSAGPSGTPAAAPVAAPVVAPPLAPGDALRSIRVRPGYEVELVASEPLTLDPVAIDWDAAGRLWVVEMADYPLGLDGRGQPGGRVRMLEDTDGDGRYDRQTIFAEGLSFPTGLLTWRDGVIVTAAPEILFLRDTNGDGRADTREVLVSGLSTGNQQLRANGLRWGLDGWVYCAAGGHHGNFANETKLRTRTGEVAVGSRDFRFHPDTGELEAQSGPSQFGRNRDDWGHWFGTQNSRALWHYVLADQYLRRNPYSAAPDPTHLVVTPLNARVWPASRPEKRFHSFEHAGHFTSACSGMIYTDDLLFARAAGESHAFTCEPFHNLVQHNVLTDDGVTFDAHHDPAEGETDFFASTDQWCRPVMTRTGPDGALWVVDMYRYMIEHPDWLPAGGRAELLPHYRLGEDKGRIYRVFPKGRRPRPWPRMDRLTMPQLVAALNSPNGWQRDQAQMLLTWQADHTAAGPLLELARAGSNALARVQALCTLDTLAALGPEPVAAALADPSPGVRENALRLAEPRVNPEVLAAAIRRVDDEDAKVRLQLAFTLGAWKEPAAGEALGRLAVAHSTDAFMMAAIMSSAGPHLRALAAAAVKAGGPILTALTDPLANLALALPDRETLAALLAPSLTARNGEFSAAQFETANRFLAAAARRKITPGSLRTRNDALGALLGIALSEGEASILVQARRIVAEEARPVPQRAAAAALLARDEAHRADALRLLGGLLGPQSPGELQRAALHALGTTGDASVPGTLLAGWTSYPPETRAVALEVILSRERWAFALLERVRDGAAVPLDVTQRARLLKHGSARVRELAGKLFAGASSRAEVIARYQLALQLAGDETRGRAVFARICVTCHKLGDIGKDVGPDLKSVAGHPPEKLLVSILDPSAEVQPGYHAYQCELLDGTELYGLIAAETANSITWKGTDGSMRVVLRKEIASLKSADVSLMPDGLESALSLQDMADLIRLLRTDGKE